MLDPAPRRWESIGLALGGAVLGFALYALLARLLGERDGFERDGFWSVLLLALALGLSLFAWERSRRRLVRAQRAAAEAEAERARQAAELERQAVALAGLQDELAAVRAELADVRAKAEADARERQAAQEAERERLGRELHRREQALERTRELNARLQASRKAEREWNRELRAQLDKQAELDEEHGLLANTTDARALVLRLAIQLVGAEKGMLISRTDDDRDGDLDLLLSHGFKHDPDGGAVSQRFAREVLARDETIRENAPKPHDGEALTPADEEIDSLVAIPLYLHDRFQGVVVCANRPGGFQEVDDDLLLALGDQAGNALHSSHLREDLRSAHRATVRMLTETLAARNPLRYQEAGEVALHAGMLAEAMGLDDRQRDTLVCAALLRDVGQLALSDRILSHPGTLTPEDRAVMELHPRISFNVISQSPALRDVAYSALYHHERFDGLGYPARVAGDAIPLTSRALAVVDAYVAMLHERPHRLARTPEEACAELVAHAATQFDPELTQLFVEAVRRRPAASPAVTDAISEALPLVNSFDWSTALSGAVASATDGLTLLSNHRQLQEDAVVAADASLPFTVAVIQLERLGQVNQEGGYAAGDRIIATAARQAERAAVRLGGAAYRDSGRRLAVLVHLREDTTTEQLVHELQTEFALGPEARFGTAEWQPGETGEGVTARARRALSSEGAPH